MRKVAKRLARNVGWLFSGAVLAKAGLLLVSVLVARRLGPESLGIFTVSSGFSLIVVPILALGQIEVLIRGVAAAPQQARSLAQAARRIQHRFLRYCGPVAAVALVLVRDTALRWALATFLVYGALRTETMTRSAVFKGLDRMDVEVKARALEFGIGLALITLLTARGFGVWATGLALALGVAAGLVWLAWREQSLPDAGPAPQPQRPLVREGLPFLGASLVLQILLWQDTLLMPLFGLAKTEIGLYGAAAIPTWGLLAGPQLLAVALYPTFSRAAAVGHAGRRAGLLGAALGIGSGLLAAVLLWRFRASVIGIFFGTGFEPAADFLGRIAWALPGASMVMLLSVVLASWRQQRWVLLATVLAALASLGLNLWWIPRAGALGAATVAVAVHTTEALLLGLASFRLLRSPSPSAQPASSRPLPAAAVLDGQTPAQTRR